jgi:hypothetical protein
MDREELSLRVSERPRQGRDGQRGVANLMPMRIDIRLAMAGIGPFSSEPEKV